MRVNLLTVGTRGDVQPAVVLGVGLKKAGFEVQVVAFEEFRSLVEAHGLGFAPVSANIQALLRQSVGKKVVSGIALFDLIKLFRNMFAHSGCRSPRRSRHDCSRNSGRYTFHTSPHRCRPAVVGTSGRNFGSWPKPSSALQTNSGAFGKGYQTIHHKPNDAPPRRRLGRENPYRRWRRGGCTNYPQVYGRMIRWQFSYACHQRKLAWELLPWIRECEEGAVGLLPAPHPRLCKLSRIGWGSTLFGGEGEKGTVISASHVNDCHQQPPKDGQVEPHTDVDRG
jgi:hypothetical protein